MGGAAGLLWLRTAGCREGVPAAGEHPSILAPRHRPSCCSNFVAARAACSIAFMEGEEAAWQDLEEIYVPAVNAGRLPLRVVAFVALPTW